MVSSYISSDTNLNSKNPLHRDAKLTFLTGIMLGHFSVSAVSRLLMGGLLSITSLSKLTNFSWFRDTMGKFELAPQRFLTISALAVVAFEFAIGIALIGGIKPSISGNL